MSGPLTIPALVLFAKTPAPGFAKTRLTPPCSPMEAAELAEAMLGDTLDLARAVGRHARLVLAVASADGRTPRHPGFHVVAQRGRTVTERLEHALGDSGPPALLIGMDTPQISTDALQLALQRMAGGARSIVGRAHDGGFWCVGVRHVPDGLFKGVALDSDDCGVMLTRRLGELDLAPHVLADVYRDVDRFQDAVIVAREALHSRLRRTLASIIERDRSSRFDPYLAGRQFP